MTSDCFSTGPDAARPAWRRWWCAPLGPVELQFRRSSVDVSVWTTLLVCPAVAVYAILARPRPDAIGLCVLCVASALVSLVALRLPWDRMVRSPWREAYYATWWIAEFSVIVAAILLGGGPGSPLLLLVLILLVFTGLSYPTASVVIATTITLLTVTALGIAYAEPVETTLIQLTAFASTGLMAYLQTRNHDRRARALTESEQRLAEAQQIAHMGSWEWRAGINRLTISDELRRILGVPATETSTTAAVFLDRIHPSDRDERPACPLERRLPGHHRAAPCRGAPASPHRSRSADGITHAPPAHRRDRSPAEVRLSASARVSRR